MCLKTRAPETFFLSSEYLHTLTLYFAKVYTCITILWSTGNIALVLSRNVSPGVFPSISFRSQVSFPSVNIDTVVIRVYLVFTQKRVYSLMCIQKIVLLWVGFLLYMGTRVPSRIRFSHPPKAAFRRMLFVLLRIGFGVKACSSALCTNCAGHPMVHKYPPQPWWPNSCHLLYPSQLSEQENDGKRLLKCLHCSC